MVDEIRVVCDQAPQHPRTRPVSLVTAFRHLGSDNEGDDNNGRWGTYLRSKRLQRTLTAQNGSVDTGRTLVDNERWSLDKHGMRVDGDVRSVYQLECASCHRYSVSAREETLFEVLNVLRHAGVGQITLQGLAARVSRMDLRS